MYNGFFMLLVIFHSVSAKKAELYTAILKQTQAGNQHADLEQIVTNILYDHVKHMKCFTMVSDQFYSDTFSKKFYKRLKVHTTYFSIEVEDSEDLISPYTATQDTLSQAKVASCSFYIILIANPIQVGRLLRFGDRYRVLDTRSNFIFLYDIRLFNHNLHYLWKRIVNVIFIREFGKKYKGKQTTIPWFEISTVPFPTPIEGVLIPRQLDIWKKGRFRTGVELFRDKTTDLRNQTLRVVTFPHIPSTVKVRNNTRYNTFTVLRNGSVGFSGLEIEILHTLAGKMNFRPKIYEAANSDIEKWGRKLDGKYTGLIGEMLSFRAEIALGDLYYNPYHLDFMDLTIPYNTECLTFLTPESSTDNSWKTLILPFKLYMWICVLVALLFSVFIFYALAKYHRYLYKNYESTSKIQNNFLTATKQQLHSKEKANIRQASVQFADEEKPSGLYIFEEFFNACLYSYSMILLISLPTLPTGWSLRMFIGWYWIYCTLVIVSYKASMTAILANPAPRITIDTLEELDESELECGGWSENIKDFFLTSLDVAGQHIGEKYVYVNNSAIAVEMVSRGEFAYYENIYYLKFVSVRHQLAAPTQENEQNDATDRNLHIMTNCVINMPISLGLQRNSPLKPRADWFIRRIIEGGFIKKWLNDVMQETLNSQIHTESDKEVKALMNLQKLYGAFVALFIGYFVSIVGLSVELLYWKFVVTKHPYFDKYTRRICTPTVFKNDISEKEIGKQ